MRVDPYLDDVRLRDGCLYLFIDIYSSRPASFGRPLAASVSNIFLSVDLSVPPLSFSHSTRSSRARVQEEQLQRRFSLLGFFFTVIYGRIRLANRLAIMRPNVTSRYDNGVDDEDNDGCNGHILYLYGRSIHK